MYHFDTVTALAYFDGERSKSLDLVQHVNQQRSQLIVAVL